MPALLTRAVERPQLGVDAPEHAQDLALIGHIGLQAQHPPTEGAQFGGQGFGGLDVTGVVERDVVSGAGRLAGDGRPYPTTGTGNQGNPMHGGIVSARAAGR